MVEDSEALNYSVGLFSSDQAISSQRYFSYDGSDWKNSQLRFLGRNVGVDLPFYQESRKVLASHVVPDLCVRNLYESLILCIASQSMYFERAVATLDKLRDVDTDDLGKKGVVWDVAKEFSRFPEDRFSIALHYAANYTGGIEGLAQDYFLDPKEVRETLVSDVKWLAHKTASFWYLCLGGEELMTIDVHNIRQMAGIMDVDPKFYEGLSRRGGKTDGKKIVKALGPKDYFALEKKVLDLLNGHEGLTLENGCVNGALLTTLFWWAGAKGRRQDLRQQEILGGSVQFPRPYTSERDWNIRLPVKRVVSKKNVNTGFVQERLF